MNIVEYCVFYFFSYEECVGFCVSVCLKKREEW